MASPWEQAAAAKYHEQIALKIPGYQLQYDLLDTLATAALTERTAARLLIVGAGGGQEILTLAQKHPHWSFTGVDNSQRMLLVAEERLAAAALTTRVSLQQCELADWDDHGLYDAATCMLVLHFVEGRERKLALLQSIASRLQPGAPLFLSAINGDMTSPAWLSQLAGWKLHMLGQGITLQQWEQFEQSFGITSHPLPAEEIEEMLRQAGFTAISRFFGSYRVDGWMAVKRGSEQDEN
ncbi:hypothetical protein B9T62_11710 [Paenibacillus donghaensis]|uniref:SAM-dependent methyltransferase n=2 Tax=Paenibacillus donghaensis TaxID=414771 RepID=A0A2Z2KT49_9BACL|nr:hypothetical protein B9T62_11710 [Paenibacillus donghaensis]